MQIGLYSRNVGKELKDDMLLYVCPNCGKKYQRKDVPLDEQCENCYSLLRIQNIDFEEKEKVSINNNASYVSRKKQGNTESPVIIEKTEEAVEHNSDEKDGGSYQLIPVTASWGDAPDAEKSIKNGSIRGRIVSVTSDGEYQRFPVERLRDKYVYHQKVSDIQNSITIRAADPDGNVSDRRVVIYGQIKGGINILRTGMLVSAYGKYNAANEFMADRIMIDDDIPISIREEADDILYFLSPIWILLIIAVLTAGIKYLPEIVSGAFASIPWKWILISYILIFSVVMWVLRRLIYMSLLNRVRNSFFIALLIEIVGCVIIFL